MMRTLCLLFLAAGWLAGCSTAPPVKQPQQDAKPAATPRGGGYYLDDGPEANPPQNLHEVPDAVPRDEPLHRFANRPYEVMGVSYTPVREAENFRQEGVASWYGKRFHGKKTASGEIYDMYGMTAAHPTLPIPSYVKVTSLDSGKSVIVRINDRGPFHSNRVIDLSYTAAFKLGLLGRGSGRVRVESIAPAAFPAQSERPQGNTPRPGYYVQLGAFGSPESAEKLLARAREALGIAPELTQVALTDGLHRANLGPFENQAEASGWMEKSRAALGIAAFTIAR